MLFRAGDRCDAMFVVESGTVTTRLTSPDGEASDLGAARDGALLGHVDLLDGSRRCADAVVIGGPAVVVVVPARAALPALRSSPAAQLALLREMAAFVRSITRTIGDQAFTPLQSRVARMLLDTADPAGTVWFDGSQTLVAQRLGVVRQTFSRCLHDLAGQGLIAVRPGGRKVALLDRHRLELLAVPVRR